MGEETAVDAALAWQDPVPPTTTATGMIFGT